MGLNPYMKPQIRSATVSDLPAINDIYNHYVVHSLCTYQENPGSSEARRSWFESHGEHYPIIVAEAGGEIVGYGSLSPFHIRSAYRFTVENSVYVRHDLLGRGFGSALLADLISRGRARGFHAIIALIDSTQESSLRVHESHGFVRCGHLKEVGFKFGRWLDVFYLECLLSRPE
jgi:phosphinothricin acetyltransferase